MILDYRFRSYEGAQGSHRRFNQSRERVLVGGGRAARESKRGARESRGGTNEGSSEGVQIAGRQFWMINGANSGVQWCGYRRG